MIKTIIKDMPPSVRALTVQSCDSCGDNYTIIINASLSYETQRAAYMHELAHIYNNDFSSTLDVHTIEAVAHYGN